MRNFKYTKTVWMSLMTLLVAVACSKKSDGGSSTVEPAPVVTTQACNDPQCFSGNFSASGGNVASNVQFVYPYNPRIEGVVNIYAVNGNNNVNNANNNAYGGGNFYGGSQYAGNQNNNSGTINPAAYYGQVSMQGQLNLSGNLCGAPAGTYNLQSVQPSNMASGVITSGQLVANGPVQITLNLYSSILYSGFTRIGFQWQVSVNGNPCGVIATY